MTGYWIAFYIYAVAAFTIGSIVIVNIDEKDWGFIVTRSLLFPVAFPFFVIVALFMKDKNK